MCCLYVLFVCAVCMCCLYVLFVCAVCMCCLYVLFVFVVCMFCLYVVFVRGVCMCCLYVLFVCAVCMCSLYVSFCVLARFDFFLVSWSRIHTGQSTGDASDEYAEYEAADTMCAIQHIVRQDWSDGRVGLYGF